MNRLACICQGIAMVIIFGMALCADGIMDTYGPAGFAIRAGACIAVSGLLVFTSNRLERHQKENRPRYRNYRGRRHQRKH